LRDLFEKNPLANGLFMSAILIGFFHGWLKVHVRGPLVALAFDIPIFAALVVTVASRGRDSLFPKSTVGDALKLHTVICLLYMPLSVLIWGVSPLVALASFRGWCIIPLIFLIGYHLATSIRQVEFYMWAMIGLGFVTAVYGIFQSEEEVRQMMLLDPEMEYRFRNQFYVGNGASQFRRFSTYVSSASFAAQLAYSITFAFSRLTVRTCPFLERCILGIMAGVMGYALILTGARSGLLQLLLAVIFAVWYRRGGVQMIIIPLIMVVVWKLGVKATDGNSTDRFSTLMEGNTIFARFWIVFEPSWEAFLEAPFGTGLGSSSHGVPVFLLAYLREVRPIDGDLGHLVVDFGIIGLISIGNLLFQCCTNAWRWMSGLRDTAMSVISLPAGIFFILTIISFPIGSPFLGVPYGSMLWFFFGALSRLFMDYDKAIAAGATETVSFREKFTSFIAAPRVRSLYTEESQEPGVPPPIRPALPVRVGPLRPGVRPGALPTVLGQSPRPQPGAKRFLYYKPRPKKD
jgi:hypothetical protein